MWTPCAKGDGICWKMMFVPYELLRFCIFVGQHVYGWWIYLNESLLLVIYQIPWDIQFWLLEGYYHNSYACSVIRVTFRSISSCTYILYRYGWGTSLVVTISGNRTQACMEGVIDPRIVNIHFWCIFPLCNICAMSQGWWICPRRTPKCGMNHRCRASPCWICMRLWDLICWRPLIFSIEIRYHAFMV